MAISLHQNQQRLVVSMNSIAQANAMIDDQIAILSRLCVMKLNDLVKAHNEAIGAKEGISGIDIITRDNTKSLFDQWHEFQKRSDIKEVSNMWFMGEDVSALPPPAEPVKEQPADQSAPQAATADHPEGAEIFGGDYGKATDGNAAVEEKQSADDGTREADAVPPVPPSDAPAS